MIKSDNAGGGLRGVRAVPSEELMDAVHSNYGIDCEGPLIDLGGSSNLNLLIADGKSRWVVRVYRPFVTSERLRDIHSVHRTLDAMGVPCNRLLSTRNGRDWMFLQNRLVEVERFIDRDEDMNSWTALEAGMPVLARMHDCLRGLSVSEAGRRPLFANYVRREHTLATTLAGSSRIRGWSPSLAELEMATDAEKLARAVSIADEHLIDLLPTQLAHGDFWDNNVFLRNGKIVFVMDFDFMGERPRIDDLALTIFFACMEFFEDPVSDAQLAQLRLLTEIYDRNCELPLLPIERTALPAAIARQPLWSIGGWVRLLDDERVAREHASKSAKEVRWALHLMGNLERWQAAFLGS